MVLPFEVMDEGFPFEAHQFKHGTTRYIATPTMLENKMLLLQLSSAFLNESIFPHVKCLSLVSFAVSLPLQKSI